MNQTVIICTRKELHCLLPPSKVYIMYVLVKTPYDVYM